MMQQASKCNGMEAAGQYFAYCRIKAENGDKSRVRFFEESLTTKLRQGAFTELRCLLSAIKNDNKLKGPYGPAQAVFNILQKLIVIVDNGQISQNLPYLWSPFRQKLFELLLRPDMAVFLYPL